MDHIRVGASLVVLLSLSMGCGDGDQARHRTPTPAVTATISALPSLSSTPTRVMAATATPLATATTTGLPIASATFTPPLAPSATSAPHDSPTPTTTACTCITPPTPTTSPVASPAARAPEVTYVGVAGADDRPQQPSDVDGAGRPVFVRAHGLGMKLGGEARRGARPLQMNAYDPSGGVRGIEMLVSRPLGDGSLAVCDAQPPTQGGVPGTDPPVFSDAPMVNDAIDDLVCRVSDGSGAPRGRTANNACTLVDPTLEYGFVASESELQFCLPIEMAWGFPLGDTVVAVRVRDIAGVASPPREIVIRVQSTAPFSCDDEQSLGEHVFTVARPSSRLLTSLTGSDDASHDPWSGSVRICAGPDLSGGVHPLALPQDAVLSLGVSDGRTLCLRLAALGSGGILDCDGGTAADVLATQTTGGSGRVTVDSGLGLDAGTGAAVLRVPIALAVLPAGVSPSTCPDATLSPSLFNLALTTATGVAQILDDSGAVLQQIQATGANFDCSTWHAAGAAKLVLPFPKLGTSAGDVAAALVLAE
jgi:hypothetical protein